MARLSMEEVDRRFADDVVWKYRSSDHARNPRVTAWDKARQRYDPSYIDKTKVKRPPYTKSGYTFRVVNNQLSNLMQATEANGRHVVAHATSPEYGRVGEVVTNAVERMFQFGCHSIDYSNPDRLERFAQGGLLYGDGVVYIDWYENGDRWGSQLHNIPLKDYFPDWRGGRWHIIRRWMNVSDLADMVASLSAPVPVGVGEDPETGEPIIEREPRDGGRAEKAFRKILQEIRDGLRGVTDEVTGGLSSRYGVSETSEETEMDMGRVNAVGYEQRGTTSDGQTDAFTARIEVLQYIEGHSDGIIALIVPGVGMAENHILRRDRNPYGICPVVHWSPSPIDNEFWGYGASEIVGSRAEVMDYLERSAVRLVAKAVDNPLLHRRNLKVRPDFLKNPAGKAYPVDDVSTAMGYLPSNVDQGAYPFMHQFIRQQADEASGSSPEQRGQTGSASSATEAAIAEAGGNTNNRLQFRRWRRAVEQIGKVFLAMLKVHITEEKAIPLVGRDADTLVRLKPEYLTGDFEIRFGGSLIGSNTQQDLANRNAIVQLYGATGVLDMGAMARKALMSIGETNPDEFLMQDIGRPKVSANHENVAWERWGQIPEVHPQDNHVEHLAKHQKVYMAVAQADPTDPRIPIMQDHLMEHWAAAQAQQQMAQQGGLPSPTGQTPMQPGSAGQPQVLNDRTANVDRMRQTSNQQTPGQAPGGVVPGRQVGGLAYGGPQR